MNYFHAFATWLAGPVMDGPEWLLGIAICAGIFLGALVLGAIAALMAWLFLHFNPGLGTIHGCDDD